MNRHTCFSHVVLTRNHRDISISVSTRRTDFSCAYTYVAVIPSKDNIRTTSVSVLLMLPAYVYVYAYAYALVKTSPKGDFTRNLVTTIFSATWERGRFFFAVFALRVF